MYIFSVSDFFILIFYKIFCCKNYFVIGSQTENRFVESGFLYWKNRMFPNIIKCVYLYYVLRQDPNSRPTTRSGGIP